MSTEEAEEESVHEQSSTQAMDPLTEKLIAIVDGYYTAIAFEPTADDRKRGVEAVQMLLLSGIGLTQIEKATVIAVRMHSPGRRIPFEVAVPLRIGMTETPPPQASALLRMPGLQRATWGLSLRCPRSQCSVLKSNAFGTSVSKRSVHGAPATASIGTGGSGRSSHGPCSVSAFLYWPGPTP